MKIARIIYWGSVIAGWVICSFVRPLESVWFAVFVWYSVPALLIVALVVCGVCVLLMGVIVLTVESVLSGENQFKDLWL